MDTMLSTTEVAERAGVTRQTVINWAKAGYLPGHAVKDDDGALLAWRFREAEVQEFIDRGGPDEAKNRTLGYARRSAAQRDKAERAVAMLAANGNDIAATAKAFGVTHNTIYLWCRKVQGHRRFRRVREKGVAV